jgi:imidazolonepropionase-like amidohydrolase
VTSVREVGGLGVYLARAVEEGTLDGPTIYGAGAILSVTGGHGDLPLDCQPGQPAVLGAHLIAVKN